MGGSYRGEVRSEPRIACFSSESNSGKQEIIISDDYSVGMRGYVLINTRPGTSVEVMKSLRETKLLKGVLTADSVFGRYDAILVIEAKDLEEFGEVMYQVIEKQPNIIRTESCIVLPPRE